MKTLTTILLICLFSLSANAQGFDMSHTYDTLGIDKRTEMSVQAITDLKSGVLVMRLRTGSNQLDVIENLLNGTSLSENQRVRFEEKKQAILEEIKLVNENLVKGFEEFYTFSEVVFMPDTLAEKLREGVRSGIFYDENLALDASISIENKTFLVAYFGKPSVGMTKTDGIVVLDNQLVELVDPFPFFTGMAHIRNGIMSLISYMKEDEIIRENVARFQKKMARFEAATR